MAKRHTDPEADTATATLEPERQLSAAEIAAQVGQEQERQQREQLREAITLWRDLVVRVAAGMQPTPAMIKQLGDLGTKLHTTPDALQAAVEALHRDRQLAQQLDEAKERLVDLRKREPELRKAMREAQDRLRALEAEALEYQRVSLTLPDLHRARSDEQAKAVLLFGNLDRAIDLLLKRDRAMGTEALAPMVQRPAQDVGRATWGS